VDVSKNVWYDHGIGAGGTIIDLVQTLQQTQDVGRALAVIADTMGAYTPSLLGHEAQRATRSRDTVTKAKPELLSV